MPDWSRRRTLQTVGAAGAFALAGCSATDSGPGVTSRGERVEPVGAFKTRETDGNPLFVPARTEPGSDGTDSAGHVAAFHHLTDAGDIEGLRFRDGATALEQFVTATDLASRSVYLLQRTVGECYDVRIVGVSRGNDGLDAGFCLDLRPADVDCRADADDVVAIAIRLPFPGDEMSHVGSSTAGSCGRRPTVPVTTEGEER